LLKHTPSGVFLEKGIAPASAKAHRY